jgi:hypothetical protein
MGSRGTHLRRLRPEEVEKLQRSLKRGGLVVVEGFYKDSVPAIGYAARQLADTLLGPSE